ncbi:Protein FAM32A, partial [Lachnellula subtilissima]
QAPAEEDTSTSTSPSTSTPNPTSDSPLDLNPNLDLKTLEPISSDGKTPSERAYEEMRRKTHRIAREGPKTHKQRVEELNKYLSTLSEHHDMPRIGPG